MKNNTNEEINIKNKYTNARYSVECFDISVVQVNEFKLVI